MPNPSQAFAGRGTKLQYSLSSVSAFVAELKSIQFTGSKYDLSDITNQESGTFKEWLPTLADAGEISFTGNLIPGNTTQLNLLEFFNLATLVNWKVILPNNLGTFIFAGYVTALDRDVPVDKEGSISGKIKITGRITFSIP